MTEVQEKLAAYFPLDAVSFKPQAVKGNRAMAVAYLNARDMMDRFDAVLGVENWQDDYTPLPDGNVICALSIRINGEWIRKVDVGNPSEQPDAGDRLKAAFSDALKRVAVKFGVGRYLYSLPNVWCDYDPVKRAFVTQPQIPAWALPAAPARPPAAKPPAAKPAPAAKPDAPPAKPGPTVEDLTALSEACCKLAGGLPDDILTELWTAAKWKAVGLDALTPVQLTAGKVWLDKKLAALQVARN